MRAEGCARVDARTRSLLAGAVLLVLMMVSTSVGAQIGGEIPDLTNLPGGCAFNPRCQWAVDRCSVEEPELIEISQGKQVACFEHASVSLNV